MIYLGLAQDASVARAALETSARDGDHIARAILRFAPDWDVFDGRREDMLREPDQAWSATSEIAARELADGQVDRAVTRVIPFLAAEKTRAAALHRLADACVQVERYEDALAVARRLLDSEPNDPQVLCLAGLCELKLGRVEAAQAMLAKSARIARKVPQFASSLRMAQRLLLEIHFS